MSVTLCLSVPRLQRKLCREAKRLRSQAGVRILTSFVLLDKSLPLLQLHPLHRYLTNTCCLPGTEDLGQVPHSLGFSLPLQRMGIILVPKINISAYLPGLL